MTTAHSSHWAAPPPPPSYMMTMGAGGLFGTCQLTHPSSADFQATMPNQNKPTPPIQEIELHITRMWKARLNDRQIVEELRKLIDTNQYGIGSVIRDYFATYEPHLIRHRKAHRLQRCHFWAAGINDLWAVDQHDKWNHFGLALHTGIEPFSGKILWIHIWHSNRNPQLILTYYLDVVEEFGFIPLITQSDPGSENFGIANAQTMLCQWHNHTLEGTLQHRWMRSRKNIKPEIMWSQLRWHFTPGFETLLEDGVHQGWYDIDNTLQLMIFRWIFIPWLQAELDAYRDRVNHTVLPHGIPELIFSSPQDYGALDLKFMVDKAALKHVCRLYVNTNHAVFNLVPCPLSAHLEERYNNLGHPTISRQTVWRIYLDLLHTIQDDALTLHHHTLLSANTDADDELPLLEGQCDLPFNETDQGYYYMGGVGGGLGLDEDHVHRLNRLDSDEEENFVEGGPDIVITEFSDEELEGSEDDWN
ncbi:hypothetical protein PISMIDRAFT_11080 [Pisolithus microcarpus 441]|uniref:Unplaced genomic scaffold scaffold_45, whole genome shotgun sequence n=1 Tax=Pisolithus microcarpus 441 TaxID=765257 RepID=A0A0C9YEB3_9AGAM|nr:hypothetical protein PISMIDRAFT_11080 [Pisolithus microcarpus 441]